MAIQTTYTHARESLASLLDEVTKNREVVIIQRRGSEDVAMITADELAGVTRNSIPASLTQKCKATPFGT